MQTLTKSDRHFFSLVSRAAFSNPFSPERDALDHEIVGTSEKLPADELEIQLVAIVEYEVSRLEKKDRLDFKKLEAKDRGVLQTTWLFRLYHRYQRAFDDFIRDQEIQGNEPARLVFAHELEKEFEYCGFDSVIRDKYIALFFQLRRAFYFIHQAIAGQSDSIVQLRMQLWRNIFTFNSEWYWQFLCEKLEDFSTLLLGETGTGKSLVAQAIGRSGFIPFDNRRQRFTESFTRSYQSINLSQYPSGVLESELFGHIKGAFTGAIQSHSGVFARCSEHGAVFIDEIGDIDITTQVKLLTVLQERLFSPVGGYEKLRFKGRVIAATNQNIHELRTQQRFRNDLYYRLCSDTIKLPTLRQRLQEDPEELRILVGRLTERFIGTSSKRFNSMVEKKIKNCVPAAYGWPGNVRELEQCIRQICLTGGYQVDPNPQLSLENTDFLRAIDSGGLSAQSLLGGYCRLLYNRLMSYEQVARATGLDRRTVKKYIDSDPD